MPGATVALRQPSSGLERVAVTDAEGHFQLPNLPAGTLDLTATLDGFTPALQRVVAPNRGREAVLVGLPGFAKNANGAIHPRGAHNQMTYVVDGLPISDRVTGAFGMVGCSASVSRRASNL